jgi:ATP-dependent exoDNAse (exonuclease V) beta subunit
MTEPQKNAYPRIHCLRASAGAGKTYQLTIRFLSLLAKQEPSPDALRQIVAITFTNRAAAEMKERIILALKKIALEVQDGPGLSRETGLKPSEAGVWLDTILAHFSDFHVRTIDSLVYALLRAFSLEMGLKPELEVVFEQDAVLDLCFDRLLAGIRWGETDDRLCRLFIELLETYLRIEEAGGLVVERGIRRKIRELYNKADIPCLAGPSPDLGKAEEDLQRSAARLLGEIRKADVEEGLHKRSFQAAYLQEPLSHVERGFFEKASFSELLTSKARGLDERTRGLLDDLYQGLKKAREHYLDILAKARVHAYMRVLEELQHEMRWLSEREGMILGGGWHSLVRGYLQGNPGAGAYAFMKLGTRIRHFLIDEFQDTSRPQWEALFPLLEESLATGGSLFYVGDVKQAIYGWRGGDWRLFKEAAADSFPSVPLEERRAETLVMNYRSLPAIVEFNNGLYRLLADEQFARRIAGVILGEKAQGWAQALLAQSIKRNFEGVEQEIAPLLQQGQEKGRVEVASFGASGAELRQAVKVRLIEQVKEVWERRKGTGIAVLVRRNQDAEDIAAWLMAEGIPVVTENSLRLRSSDLIKGLVAFLRFLDYPLDDLAFWGAIASRLFRGLPGIPPEVLDDFSAEGRWQPPLYRAFDRRLPEVAAEFIRPLLARVGFVTPYDLAREVVERFHLLERFAEEQVFIHRFFELIFQTETRGQRSLSHFLQFWEEGGREEKIGLPEEISAVRVLTVHKAKGLEFPVVFVPFTNWRLEPPSLVKLDEGCFVNLKRPLPAHLEKERTAMMINDALEALNLLYVATTRAEAELYLYETSLPPPRGKGADRSYLAAWLREMLIQTGCPGYG